MKTEFAKPLGSLFPSAGPRSCFCLITVAMLLPAMAHGQGAVEAWVQRYNGPGNLSDNPHAISLDASGNVYVTGSSCRTGSYGSEDYVTIKYSGAGLPLWTNRLLMWKCP